ncbi:MAG: hypothetical protein QX189_15115 [Methylococcales bacterium]
MALYTIVYASTATKEMSDDDLLLILEKSRIFNRLVSTIKNNQLAR